MRRGGRWWDRQYRVWTTRCLRLGCCCYICKRYFLLTSGGPFVLSRGGGRHTGTRLTRCLWLHAVKIRPIREIMHPRSDKIWPRRRSLLMNSVLKESTTLDLYWLNTCAYCDRKHCNRCHWLRNIILFAWVVIYIHMKWGGAKQLVLPMWR